MIYQSVSEKPKNSKIFEFKNKIYNDQAKKNIFKKELTALRILLWFSQKEISTLRKKQKS